MEALSPGNHYCPRVGCSRVISNRFFACLADWHALPGNLQRRVYATASLSIAHPLRQEVFADARQAWGEGERATLPADTQVDR